MFHKNYFEINADSYYDLGFKEGLLFADFLLKSIEKEKQKETWKRKFEKSKEYLEFTKNAFPQFIEELKGYAKGASANFEDLWVLSLEDEFSEIEKCTTIITKSGKLIAHNEDFGVEADAICILKKSIKNFTILEIFYYNTLGGNAIYINSHGIVQTINSLDHTDKRMGIPRNVIARWFSETNSPEESFIKFLTLPRSSGYNHNFINLKGKIWNIEASASNQKLSKIDAPFVHTNHFLTELKEVENCNNIYGTFDRYAFAKQKIEDLTSLEDLKIFLDDKSKGEKRSIFNDETIASVIVDLENLIAHIRLQRETEKGWVNYDLNFLRI